MTKKRKDTLAVITAIVMLVIGAGLCIAGFIVDPLGIIDNSVLWIMGQCLLYAGSIFGIGMYVKATVKDEIEQLKQ